MSGFGPYHSEKRVVAALRRINGATNIEPGMITVHVYQTTIFDRGIGRRYLGPLDATTILMTGAVDESRLQRS